MHIPCLSSVSSSYFFFYSQKLNHISAIVWRKPVARWRWLKVMFAGIPFSTVDGCIFYFIFFRCKVSSPQLLSCLDFFLYLNTVRKICMFQSSKGFKRRTHLLFTESGHKCTYVFVCLKKKKAIPWLLRFGAACKYNKITIKPIKYLFCWSTYGHHHGWMIAAFQWCASYSLPTEGAVLNFSITGNVELMPSATWAHPKPTHHIIRKIWFSPNIVFFVFFFGPLSKP